MTLRWTKEKQCVFVPQQIPPRLAGGCDWDQRRCNFVPFSTTDLWGFLRHYCCITWEMSNVAYSFCCLTAVIIFCCCDVVAAGWVFFILLFPSLTVVAQVHRYPAMVVVPSLVSQEMHGTFRLLVVLCQFDMLLVWEVFDLLVQTSMETVLKTTLLDILAILVVLV